MSRSEDQEDLAKMDKCIEKIRSEPGSANYHYEQLLEAAKSINARHADMDQAIFQFPEFGFSGSELEECARRVRNIRGKLKLDVDFNVHPPGLAYCIEHRCRLKNENGKLNWCTKCHKL